MSQRAKIYQPVKTAMQSGKARTKFWILEFNKSNSSKDFVMGWTSSSNTSDQVKLKFETQIQAIKYAELNNIQFDLIMAKKNKLIIKAYADNFLNNV
ncbi:MAG: hypothetical protein EXR13_02265 [Candidatus Fonsibacter sp.]|nr:hypothetical protein [Candidatus Fonsibacter sp.]